MNEEEARQKLAAADEKRNRAALLRRMAEWPMFVRSEVKADKRRGRFWWFGSVSNEPLEHVALTREERQEFADWMRKKADRLAREANEVFTDPRTSDP